MHRHRESRSTPFAAFGENRALSDLRSARRNKLIVSARAPAAPNEAQITVWGPRTLRGTVNVPSTSNNAIVRFVMAKCEEKLTASEVNHMP